MYVYCIHFPDNFCETFLSDDFHTLLCIDKKEKKLRYILLGLSCSLTACLETETTSQTQNNEVYEKEENKEVYEKEENKEAKNNAVPPPTPVTAIPEEAPVSKNQDAGEGAKAKVEEGEVVKVHKSTTITRSRKVKVSEKELSESVGVSGLLGAERSGPMAPSTLDAFMGSEGVFVGGTSIQGGSKGLGGLGTKGNGRSGLYGSPVMKSDKSYAPLAQNTEQYTDHGVNEFTKTSEDALRSVDLDFTRAAGVHRHLLS